MASVVTISIEPNCLNSSMGNMHLYLILMSGLRKNPRQNGLVKKPGQNGLVFYPFRLVFTWDSCPVDHTINHCYIFCMIVKLIKKNMKKIFKKKFISDLPTLIFSRYETGTKCGFIFSNKHQRIFSGRYKDVQPISNLAY
jgi:hypothetical protein